jgi:hypothetical protein
VPKVTIYVPDELQDSMDAMQLASKDLNWSSLAQEAFRREIERWNQLSKLSAKTRDAVDRLRRSKEKLLDEAKASGDIAGRKWATEKAEYIELVRLRKYVARNGGVVPKPTKMGKVWPVFDAIFDADPDSDEYDTDWVRDFWTDMTDDASDDFVDAFVGGALDVFAEIEPQL